MGFLRNTYLETRTIQNWLPNRFENSYRDLVSDVRIWEEVDGDPPRIVAMANPENPFLYFIQIHPDYTPLEEEIVRWIEDHCAALKPDPSTEQKFSIGTLDWNSAREALLRERGFEKGPDSLSQLCHVLGCNFQQRLRSVVVRYAFQLHEGDSRVRQQAVQLRELGQRPDLIDKRPRPLDLV